MRYFLGVDIGGTKSHAIIADETGAVKGFAHAGAGNHEVVGYEGLSAVLQALLADATAAAAIDASDLAGAGFGVAGYDWPSERQPTLDAIVTLGLHCPVEAVNDTIIGLLAGAEAGWGVAIVGGTSNNCRGWDRHHREGRVLGNGIPFGEYGGAVEAVLKAVHAVAAAWTRRGPATSLSDAFVALVGARDVAAGVDHDHQGRPDGQRRQRARVVRLDHGLTDRQDEEERSDELDDELLRHGADSGPERLKINC